MQNKKRNRKRGQATFSALKNGDRPHFSKDTIFRRELSLISIKE